MGKDTLMVALDSNSLTYLIDALEYINRPTGPLVEDKVALARSYFYLPECSPFHLSPTVFTEYGRIADEGRLAMHESWTSSHFCPIVPRPDPATVEEQAGRLLSHHSDVDDCRVVAECQLSAIRLLVTRDGNLRKRLGPHSGSVKLLSPREFWTLLDVKPGTAPRMLPTMENPLISTSWWRA